VGADLDSLEQEHGAELLSIASWARGWRAIVNVDWEEETPLEGETFADHTEKVRKTL
jgi:hypothetical protein